MTNTPTPATPPSDLGTPIYDRLLLEHAEEELAALRAMQRPTRRSWFKRKVAAS